VTSRSRFPLTVLSSRITTIWSTRGSAMNPQDLRLILLLALALAVVVLLALVVLGARRSRVLAAEVVQRDAHASAERDRIANELANTQRELARVHARGQQLDSDLGRYRSLRDAESELRRVQSVVAATEREAAELVATVEAARRTAHAEIETLQTQIADLRRELGWFEQERYFESFGLYAPRYDFATSADYKGKLGHIRERQRDMVKQERAALCATTWTVAGSEKKGRKMVADYLKLMLRAFNGECDAAVAKVTAQNVEALADRIRKTHELLNKLGTVNECSIVPAYLALKLEELFLFHEYRVKKEAEREEQRAIQEQIRDEKRALDELERARKKVEDEERRYEDALAKARADVEQATGAKHARLLEQIATLETQLADAKERERTISQAELTRAGHVYVISNIGSFGEHVYKIGMTRRLDPQDRVTELGDASVPFPFDVHAIISTTDAPKLENELHRIFTARRVNTVNLRKEFFAVSLEEIEAAVHRLHGHFEFTKLAEATEYRASQAARTRPTSAPLHSQRELVVTSMPA
jgi:hypothetical protein